MFLKQIKKVNIFIRKMSISEILCTTAKTKKNIDSQKVVQIQMYTISYAYFCF